MFFIRMMVCLQSLGVTLGDQGKYGQARFGREVREKYFQFRKGFLNFNHGGFGATPLPVRLAQNKFTDDMEAEPTQWLDPAWAEGGHHGYVDEINKVRPRLAEMAGAKSAQEIAFVENASNGLNAVLRSMLWQTGDVLLLTDAAYAVMPNTARFLTRQYGVRVVTVPINYPVAGDEAYLAPLRATLAQPDVADHIRLAVFPHISSLPNVVLPVVQLAKVVKAANPNALIMIDGAHAFGQIHLNISRDLEPVGVDYYIMDGHKWLMAPHGSGALWASPRAQAPLVPVVISSEEIAHLPFPQRFDYVGTRDYTPWCAMGAALDFRNDALGGDEVLMKYIHDLAIWGAKYMADTFKTQLMAPANMTAAIFNVQLPIPPSWSQESRSACELSVRERLRDDFNMQVIQVSYTQAGIRIGCQNCSWTRVASQVYLERADFVSLTEAILKIISDCKPHAHSIVV